MEQNVKNANILLIDINYDLYNRLKKSGFDNITYFKSEINANEYFNEHPEELDEYDAYFCGPTYTPGDDNYEKYSLFSEYCKNNNKLFMYFAYSSHNTEIQSNSITYWVEFGYENWSRDTNRSHIVADIETTINEAYRLNDPNHLLRELYKLSDKKISYKKQEEIKKRPIPSKCSQLKVLFCGSGMDLEQVKSFLNELGIGEIKIETTQTYSYKDVFKTFPHYDLVIADRAFCLTFTESNRYEIKELLKNTDNTSVTFINYQANAAVRVGEANLNTTTIEVTTVSNEVGTIKKYKHDFYGSRTEHVAAMLGASFNLYNKINKIEDLKEFPKPESYNKVAMERQKKINNWRIVKNHINSIHLELNKYIKLAEKRRLEKVPGLEVQCVTHKKGSAPLNLSKDKDYLVITYSLLRVPLYALHIPVFITEDEDYIPVIIETANKKGVLSNLKIFDIAKELPADAENLGQDEDNAVEAIYNTVVDRIRKLNEEATNPPSNAGHNRQRKPYNGRRF